MENENENKITSENPDLIPPIDPIAIKNKSVQTYAADMAQVLTDNKEGLIKKVIHEQEEKEANKKNFSPESRKNKIFMRTSLALSLLSIVILGLIYWNQDVIKTVEVKPQFMPLVFTDTAQFQDITGLSRDEIIANILQEVKDSKVKTGGVEGIYLTENKNAINFKRFIKLIKGNLFLDPKAKTNIQDNYLIGLANGETRDVFILLKVGSFEGSFGELRQWESRMFSDISGFFNIPVIAETNYLTSTDFVDGYIQNKNARILYGNDGNIVIMYVYLNSNTVLITHTENAVKEVLLRLSANQHRK